MSKGNGLSALERFLHGTPYRATSQLKIFQLNFPCTVIKQFPGTEMRHAMQARGSFGWGCYSCQIQPKLAKKKTFRNTSYARVLYYHINNFME